ncbi:amino acid ABC transporter ATP-binding/permease protein [Actinomyces gaoshouyii]|uniref:amino acid ABC transporter ATP-binding/permease protein n=1 Tax=Actinomyces gaoshouyii TaxID=1960083 RepID=UPI0009BECA85|nr:ABC transporter ATP-binding protein [Actinomyces gaoshouyii]ARD42006.1 ABC transporter ATP-binding protein [Actinomyces gaoshouyii]
MSTGARRARGAPGAQDALKTQTGPGGATEAASTPPSPPSRRALIGWLLSVTRPVLAPLVGSTLCRIAELLLGCAIMAIGAIAVVRTGAQAASGAPIGIPWDLAGQLALASLLKAALRYSEQFLGHFVAFKALELLRGEIFAALIPRAPRVMLEARSGDLLARATKDVDRIEVFFAHTFAPAVSAVVVPLSVVGVVGATTSWPVALTALIFLAGAIGAVPALGWRASLASSRGAVAERAGLTQHVTDSIQGMAEVVGYGRVDERLEEMGAIDRAIQTAGAPARRWTSLRRGGVQLLTLLGPAAMILVGADDVRAGAFSAAALAGGVAAVVRLAETARGVEEFAAALTTSFAAAERVWATAHSPIEVVDGQEELPRAGSHELVWEGVSYAYPDSPGLALEGASVRAAAGRWTCLVGVSGSGKTTMGQLALRFDDPATGRILLDGVDIRDLRGDCLRREVALVSQSAHLFRASVLDNLRLAAPGASEEEVRRACQDAGIHDDIMALESGYGTMIGERGASLSGGQRQRLALARALLVQPGVVVLDEFTSHLDPALDARVRSRVRKRLAGTTVVEITHRLQWVGEADHVAVLDGGRVVEQGAPAALMSAGGELARLMARQA